MRNSTLQVKKHTACWCPVLCDSQSFGKSTGCMRTSLQVTDERQCSIPHRLSVVGTHNIGSLPYNPRGEAPVDVVDVGGCVAGALVPVEGHYDEAEQDPLCDARAKVLWVGEVSPAAVLHSKCMMARLLPSNSQSLSPIID